MRMSTEQEQSQIESAKVVNFPRKVAAFGKEYEVRELTLGPMIRALPVDFNIAALSDFQFRVFRDHLL